MARTHQVKRGESLYTIAAAYQIADWTSMWIHPQNADLRQKRKNPQVLYPGDTVTIPDAPTEGGIVAKLDDRLDLTRRRRGCQPIDLQLLCLDFEPMATTEYTLSYGSKEIRGETDARGNLTAEIPLDVKQLKLTVGEFEWDLRPGELNPLSDTGDDGLSGAQGRLKNLGLFDGEIDGESSPEFERALRGFQLRYELPRTGVLDVATLCISFAPALA